jgi:glycosyltransferase involved in cell wall biosynthesis
MAMADRMVLPSDADHIGGTRMTGASGAVPAILMVAPSRELTFVEHDVQILSKAYRVEIVTRGQFPGRRRLLPEVWRRLRDGRHAVVYLWFAEPHDSPFVILLARLLGRRTAVAAGGYELTALPELGYGGLIRRADRAKVQLALKLADAVLPSSDLLADEVRMLCTPKWMRVIYPGVDCARFAPDGARERMVVTVGTASEATWRLKGLDVFARCSRLVPDARFVIVGPCPDSAIGRRLRELGGPNLELTERRLSLDEVARVFQRARVAVQLSARESFGLALAEAMAAGCIPVATRTGFLPDVVGDTGFLVETGDVTGAAGAIRAALERTDGMAARTRVRDRFACELREQALLESMRRLVG